MAPYFVIFSLLAFFAMIDAFDPPRRQKLFILLLCFAVLALFAGLRVDGVDFDNYLQGFRDVERTGLDYTRLSAAKLFEPGYNFLVWITAVTTHSPTMLFLLIAAIAVGLNLSCYKDYSNYFLIAVMLYFVHTFLLREMMQIRAGVAAALCLYSLRRVEGTSRSLAKFLITVAIAASFHLASVFFVMVYWLYHREWGRRVWIWIVAASLVVAYLIPLGRFLSNLPGGGLQQRITVYSWMLDQSTGILTNPTILKQLFIAFVGLWFWDVLSEKVPRFRLLFIPMLLSVCWLLVWNDFQIVAARIATFFSVTEVLVIPAFLALFTPRSRPVVTFGIVFFAFAVLYLHTQESLWPEYVNIFSMSR